MGIDMTWCEEAQTCLYIHFTASWDWAECRVALMKVFDIIEGTPYTVNLLFDFSGSPTTAKTSSRKYLDGIVEYSPDNVGFIALVGTQNNPIATLSSYFFASPKTRKRTLILATPEGAYSILNGLAQRASEQAE